MAQIRKGYRRSLGSIIVGARFSLSYGGMQIVRRQRSGAPKQLNHRCTVKRLAQMKQTFGLSKEDREDRLFVLLVHWTFLTETTWSELDTSAFCFCDGYSCMDDRGVVGICCQRGTKEESFTITGDENPSLCDRESSMAEEDALDVEYDDETLAEEVQDLKLWKPLNGLGRRRK